MSEICEKMAWLHDKLPGINQRPAYHAVQGHGGKLPEIVNIGISYEKAMTEAGFTLPSFYDVDPRIEVGAILHDLPEEKASALIINVVGVLKKDVECLREKWNTVSPDVAHFLFKDKLRAEKAKAN